MDLMRTGFKFFKWANDEDCPISPDGARRLCDTVEQIKQEQWRIKLIIVYIAAVLSFSSGADILEVVLKVFIG